MKRRIFAVFAGLLLAGCATTPLRVAHPRLTWQAHKARLRAIKTFSLSAEAALRTGGHGGTVHLRWQERPKVTRIGGYGPFGELVFRLQMTQGRARLVTRKGVWRATNPDLLLGRLTGWRLPVKGLRYWILGEPRPYVPDKITLNGEGLLGRLAQSGWSVVYRRYRQTPLGRLPALMDLDYNGAGRTPAIHIRIHVSHWGAMRG